MSLLRATFRPDIISDIGIHNFCYVICPHEGNHMEAKINQKAYEYNVPISKPLLPFVENSQITSFLYNLAKNEGLYLQSLKIGENGEATDVIGYHPFEIITFSVII